MTRLLASCAVWMITTCAVFADAQVSIAMDRLRVGEMIGLMRVEGADYAESLNQELLNGQGGAVWQAQVDEIYDPARMMETVRAPFDAISDAHLRQINLFFGAPLGVKIIELELAGRAAMADDTIEAYARETYAQTLADAPESLAPIEAFVAAGDMLERNVTGALTANYRFYRAMVDGGAFQMSEDEILAEAWAQEDEIREDTQRWLMGYLMLSYQPLEDAEFETYLDFTRTDAGRALNAAVFDGFNTMYADISYALGRVVALNMAGSDL